LEEAEELEEEPLAPNKKKSKVSKGDFKRKVRSENYKPTVK